MRPAVRELEIPPWTERHYDPRCWRDALVLVESGAIELESEHGVRVRFEKDALLPLRGGHLRRLVNPGARPVKLIAITRT